MEPQGVERKLTTILSADVASYSRLMSEDEEGTLRTLNAYREVVDGLITAHRGRVFASAGDSVVAEPGGLCISGKVHDEAAGKTDAKRPVYGLATQCLGTGTGVSTVVE